MLHLFKERTENHIFKRGNGIYFNGSVLFSCAEFGSTQIKELYKKKYLLIVDMLLNVSDSTCLISNRAIFCIAYQNN